MQEYVYVSVLSGQNKFYVDGQVFCSQDSCLAYLRARGFTYSEAMSYLNQLPRR